MTNSIVPIPTIPPNSHPDMTAENYIKVLIPGREKLVTLCIPIIRTSLGPGPKLQVK